MVGLTVAGRHVEPGHKEVIRVPVTRDLCGDVDLFAHVMAGREAGPTLLLLSMLHGNEWFSVLILRALLARLDPERLRGNVVAIPVANPPAMATGTRCLLDDSDEPDANRAFGGPYQWLSNQITRTIAGQFFSIANYLIDYHVSDWGSTMADVSFAEDYTDPKISSASRAMAMAFGFPVVHRLQLFSGLRGSRTSLGHAGEHYGIPGIVAEIGGLGFGDRLEEGWLEANVTGTLGVMRHLGMIEGEAARCDRYLMVSDYWRVGPEVGGYLEPVVGLDRQFTEVQKNELLARVTSPTTFEVIDEIRSPGRGAIFYTCRAHMVRPGSWAFGVADLEGGRAEWIDE